MHVCVVHVSVMQLKFCHGRTNERTNKAILGVGCMMYIHMFLDHYAYVLDALMYDAYIHDP